MNREAVGVDIAKSVFQVLYIDQESGEIVNKAVKRAKFLEHFANRTPCLIGMEACGGAHHWARQLTKMGHQVKLMPAEFVKAFNIRNKNDAADARAIWLAVQQPGKPVAVPSMPLMPATRPDSTIRMAAYRPIKMPPATESTGVKRVQSTVTADLPHRG